MTRLAPARPVAALVVLAAAAVLVLGGGLLAGSAGWGGIGDATILWQVRAPRVAAGFATGALLAVAGALLQGLTRNPLSDPHVIGVSGGASVGAMLWLMLGSEGGAAVGAMLGAALAAGLLLLLSWRVTGRSQPLAAASAPGGESSATVLLLGVMIGAAAAAVVSVLLTLAPEGRLRGMVFWLLGDLNGVVAWQPAFLALVATLALAWPWSRELDLMARGEAWAATLGVPVARRRRQVLLAAAVATGAAVATAGAVGFVGLGGAFVVVADAVARSAFAPLQLPVGVLSAAVGVPVFVALLLRRGRR
ncbi:iron chelate uptake ABC transporter family permease subunit [uncultured Methylibium sp.]|uniref:iron chelate uptake ABC transporter family permease subunit n=1 Tax=uncultured Methylibium sp. TaxID=381093 RepID=UPI0025E181D4|nr:iron chelate uptake ABC transporter family permease subunit [uncultured Methylibium sp.]